MPVAPGTSTTAPAGDVATAPGTEAITLRYWNESRGADLEMFCQAANSFMDASGGEVVVECTGFDELAKVVAASAAGDPPELVQSWERTNVPGMFEQGGIIPLNDYMEKDQFDTSIIVPAALEGCRTYDQTYFALPNMCYSASDFFWNKAIFEEHGLDPEQPPTTVEELWDLQEEFDVYEDDKPVVLAFHPKASMHAETWALCFGGQFWDPETLQVTPQHPGNVAGMEWMMRYAEKYGAETLDRLSQSYGQYQSANNPFLSGVLVTTSFWDAMVAYRDRYAEGVEMGFSNFPHPEAMPEQEGFGRLNFNPTFIPQQAKNPEQAWALLKFIAEDIATNILVATTLANTPQNILAIESPENTAGPMLLEIQRYASSDGQKIFPPSMPVASMYATEWRRQTDLIYHGEISVEDGLQKIYDLIQPELDKAIGAAYTAQFALLNR